MTSSKIAGYPPPQKKNKIGSRTAGTHDYSYLRSSNVAKRAMPFGGMKD